MTRSFSQTAGICLMAAAAFLLGFGCKSANTNSPVAKANTGYVDFYTSTNAAISWEIKEVSPETKTLFSQVNPVTDPIVRIGLPPGHYRLQIRFLNRTIEKPAELDLDVRNGMITPVKVELREVGEISTRRIETSIRPSIKPNRMGKDIDYQPADLYQITASPRQPVAYQPKEAMTYHK